MPNPVINSSLCVSGRITTVKYILSLFIPSITPKVPIRVPIFIFIFEVTLTWGERKKQVSLYHSSKFIAMKLFWWLKKKKRKQSAAQLDGLTHILCVQVAKERDVLTEFDNQISNSVYLYSYDFLELKIETTSYRGTLLILLFPHLHVRGEEEVPLYGVACNKEFLRGQPVFSEILWRHA